MEAARGLILQISAFATSRRGVWIFFAVTLLLGLFVAKDYGISWDEKAMHVLGEKAYYYVFHGREYPEHVGIRFHGAWFEILQYAVETAFNLRYARSIYILRHAMTYVFFWVGLLGMYVLALRSFKHRGWALLATAFLFLSPRLFGHAFVNARDIPSMACFIVKMVVLLYFLEYPSYWRAVLLGVASGLIMSIRVGGLFVPFYVVFFFGLSLLHDSLGGYRIDWKRAGLLMALYAVTFMLSTIALWPLLWEQPFAHFRDAMVNMITAQQGAGGLYFGEMVSGVLPWHWIPVHIVTKTPLLYIALFIVGVITLFLDAWKRPLSLLEKNRDMFLFFLWFFIPIFIVVVLKGHLFDEWRHVYFIYPALLLLAVHGFRSIWQAASAVRLPRGRMLAQAVVVLVCAGSLLGTAGWMIRNHPLQYVYYSIPSRWVEGYFPLDYWGLSYRKGFEWVLAHDESDLVTVQVQSSPGWENLNILTQQQRKRIVVKNENFVTKYILDNYQRTSFRHTLPDEDQIHAIRVSGIDVLGIYRNPRWTPASDDGTERMEEYEVQERFDAATMP